MAPQRTRIYVSRLFLYSAWQQQSESQGLQRKERFNRPSSFCEDKEKLKTVLDSGAVSIYVLD